MVVLSALRLDNLLLSIKKLLSLNVIVVLCFTNVVVERLLFVLSLLQVGLFVPFKSVEVVELAFDIQLVVDILLVAVLLTGKLLLGSLLFVLHGLHFDLLSEDLL